MKKKIEKDDEVEEVIENSEKILGILNSKSKDKYDELGCEFKNEDECEEEMDEEDASLEDSEKEHFDSETKGYEEEI